MFDPELLAEVRQRFHHVDSCPYSGPRAFFENAGGSLTLRSVVAMTAELMALPDNQGRSNVASAALGELIDRGKRDMLTLFGADSGLAFVGETGTELLGRIIRSAVWASAGSAVVGSHLEHPATYSACRRWADLAGKSYIQVPFDPDTSVVGVDQYREALTPDLAVATIIHASPVTGMHVDVGAIAAEIRSVAPDCFIIVDGIQHAAHGHIDVASYDIDGYVVSGYKLFSRHNYGVAWISDRLAGVPHDKLDGAPQQQWELGTRDASAYATFSEVVRYLEWLGGRVSDDAVSESAVSNNAVSESAAAGDGGGAAASRELLLAAADAIRAQEHGLVDAMMHGTGGLAGLAQLDAVSVVGPVSSEHRAGMVSFEIDGVAAGEVVEALNLDGVRAHVRKRDHFSTGILEPLGVEACVRASICHYNSTDEVERFLATVNRLASA